MAIVTVSMVPRPSLSRADPVHEVQVMAKKFAFEPSIIQVVAGEPVRLVIRSGDAVHGFAIRDLNIDVPIPRGGGTVTAVGLVCSCGNEKQRHLRGSSLRLFVAIGTSVISNARFTYDASLEVARP